MRRLCLSALVLGAVFLCGSTAEAGATTLPPPLVNVGTKKLAGNDDGSTAAVSLGFKINYFGTTYSSVYVNNNGNLSFGAPVAAYTPEPLGNEAQPMIAPFWADVDTTIGNPLTYGTGTVNGHPAFVATWPAVGCYDGNDANNENDSVQNTFQVALISRSYNRMLWTGLRKKAAYLPG